MTSLMLSGTHKEEILKATHLLCNGDTSDHQHFRDGYMSIATVSEAIHINAAASLQEAVYGWCQGILSTLVNVSKREIKKKQIIVLQPIDRS